MASVILVHEVLVMDSNQCDDLSPKMFSLLIPSPTKKINKEVKEWKKV